ncbi:pimeloyl-ACP methyl ester carboxylesterase [Bradyrhizobium sp. BR13661]|jgi:pimeloyl-ACP methyl ester carboxylesterase|nr:pimeloyl-ACP methyl ester carboxylesterase [Bradyrhizobium sp. BR13661]
MGRLTTFLTIVLLMVLPGTALAAERVDATSPGGDPDISIHLISKKAPNEGRNPILMLHAFGSPCAEAFDLAPGLSWMDDLNQVGFTAYAIDFRGFGHSSRPNGDTPIGRAPDAVRDVIAVIEAIRKETGAAKVSMVGWSWGAVVAPMVAIARPDLIDRMVLVGAMHAFKLPMMTEPFAAKDNPTRFGPAHIPYQKLDASMVLGHWQMMLKGTSGLVDTETVAKVQALAERCGHIDPVASPKIVVRPMGPLADLFDIWSDRPIYDAAKVNIPTLIMRGDRDFFADERLAAKIRGAREIVVPDATHWGPYERNRDKFLTAASAFLAGKDTAKENR